MEAKAVVRHVGMSPRKMRVIANLVRGKRVEEAMSMLKLMPKKGAVVIRKLLISAVANAEQQGEDRRGHAPHSRLQRRQRPDPGSAGCRARWDAPTAFKNAISHVTVVAEGDSTMGSKNTSNWFPSRDRQDLDVEVV